MANKTEKPKKPYTDFPLFPHATGRWAKKIRGKQHYFGPWNDPDAALKKYLTQRDELQAGRTPRSTSGGLTVRDMVNRFLTAKQYLVETQELMPRTFRDYHTTCELIIDHFGKSLAVSDVQTADFEKLRAKFAKTRGLVSLGNVVRMVRIVFKYAFDADLIERPIKFGPGFKLPSKKALRTVRNSRPRRMFEAVELQQILKAADQPLKAMILLGINCGFGQTDISRLPRAALNLETGWANFPRPKTAVERRCPLWKETIAALKSLKRPNPKVESDAGLVFITKYGAPFVRINEKGTVIDAVGLEFGKLLRELKLKRMGLNFYALRHTFETIAGDSRDQVAVDFIMGHAPGSDDMAAVYRERIGNERLVAVTEFLHRWLFAKPKTATKKTE